MRLFNRAKQWIREMPNKHPKATKLLIWATALAVIFLAIVFNGRGLMQI